MQAQWGKLAPAWEKLQNAQLEKLKSLAGNNLDALFTQISKADLAALSEAVQSKLGFGPEVIERLRNITLADVAGWADEQWDRVPVDNLASMGWSVLQKVPISELGKWTQVCIVIHCISSLIIRCLLGLLFFLFLPI